MAGKLYLVATPIGNLEDMTYRAVRVLNEVELIAAEDTRNSIKLLNHFDIKTPMTSYHEYNKYDKAKLLVEKMVSGQDVAIITDAGTPGISDPGEELVKQALEAGLVVSPVPGACACISALISSGLPTRRFAFEAFLPHDKKERKRVLFEMQQETRTLVMYEAPHKLRKTLDELLEVLGDRRITFAREITKKHETIEQMTLSQAVERYREEEPRGEYVLVIEGADVEKQIQEARQAFENMTLGEHVEMYVSQGMSKKDAIKQVATDRGIPKREVYNEVMT
jgi:16S rRNA (cytidine1402-2'-O)-methyltransferase